MIEFVPNTLGLKIMGRDGKYSDFAGVALMGHRPTVELGFTNGKSLECSFDHRLMTPQGRIAVKDLDVGSRVYRADGRTTRVKSLCRLVVNNLFTTSSRSSDGHQYVANGILNSNCKFVTDEETLIDPMCLSRLRTPDKPAYFTKQVRWYLEPLPNRTYLVALDPSMGTGGDYAAIQVFMLPELIQVAEWQHNETRPARAGPHAVANPRHARSRPAREPRAAWRAKHLLDRGKQFHRRHHPAHHRRYGRGQVPRRGRQ
jgi:hypothetical protein